MNSVLIVDDHPVARLAVRMLLEKDGMTVIGETDDGLKAVQQVRQLLPDLVIVDIDIPSINGINVVQRLRANGFKGGILVLTGKDDDHYIKRCAGAGADGFISKRNNLSELHDAIRAIKSGYGFFPLTAPARTPLAIFRWTTKIKSPACLKRNCRFCTF
jgi:two-component system response regulator EvgA